MPFRRILIALFVAASLAPIASPLASADTISAGTPSEAGTATQDAWEALQAERFTLHAPAGSQCRNSNRSGNGGYWAIKCWHFGTPYKHQASARCEDWRDPFNVKVRVVRGYWAPHGNTSRAQCRSYEAIKAGWTNFKRA